MIGHRATSCAQGTNCAGTNRPTARIGAKDTFAIRALVNTNLQLPSHVSAPRYPDLPVDG